MTTPIRIGFFLPHSGNFNRVFEALTANPTFGEKPGFEGVKVSGDHYHVYSKHWTFQPWEPRAAPPWNGEGAPPAGIQVEIKLKSTRADWCPATVLFCQDDALILAWKAEGVARPTTLSAVDIRPIRTAEQIAAEERENGVQQMVDAISWGAHVPETRRKIAYDLYDAGARMPGEGQKA